MLWEFVALVLSMFLALVIHVSSGKYYAANPPSRWKAPYVHQKSSLWTCDIVGRTTDGRTTQCSRSPHRQQALTRQTADIPRLEKSHLETGNGSPINLHTQALLVHINNSTKDPKFLRPRSLVASLIHCLSASLPHTTYY